MKFLLFSLLKNRKHYALIFLAIVAMCSLTLASQLEIVTLGILTNQGDASHSQPAHSDYLRAAINFIDDYLQLSKNLNHLIVLLVAVALIKASSLFFHRYMIRLLAIRVSQDLRQRYFEHIQLLPMSFYQKYHIGALSSRVVGDSSQIAEAVNACLINYIQTPFTLISTLSLCFLTSWKLTLMIFFGFPLIVFPIVFLAKRVKRVSKQLLKNQEGFATVLIDFLAGIQTVKMFAMEDFSLDKYRDQNNRMVALEKKSARYDVSARPILHTIGMFFLAATLVYGLYILKMTVSEVIVYCGFLYIFYEPIKKFAEENTHIQKGIAAAERMLEVLNLKPDIEDRTDASSFKGLKGKIEFKNVWFKYEDEWVLRGLDLTIEKGQTVALVGPTGAGKSTIVHLLPRLYEIQKGEILIDERPIADYTQRSLRDSIAFIPQKPFLFLDTVAKNISFGRSFSDDEIVAAAKKAHAEEFILKLPEKYETEIAEGGKNLSGGQQQRLAIARALVKKASILIMDEATSALDAVSENHIKSAVKDLRGKMTQIIIAHRLSTVEDADKIIYLDNGVKIAEGTKEELLKSCPGFKAMWEMLHRSNHE